MSTAWGQSLRAIDGPAAISRGDPLDTLLDVLGREPIAPRRLNSQIPRGLELICLKCLAKKPEHRYASAAALADDLDRFARGEPLEARPPQLGTAGRAGRGGSRHGLATGGAFAVFYLVELVN